MQTVVDKNRLALAAIGGGTAVALLLIGTSALFRYCGKEKVVVVPQAAQLSAVPAPPLERGPLIEITTSDSSVAEVGKAVARHMFLPSGNVKVATVENPDNLRKENPVFYENAKKGDKVLIYPDRAILYNPEVDRVIDIAHFSK